MPNRNPADASSPPTGSGSILSLVSARRAISRAELMEASGLARATVTHRLAGLFADGLIRESADTLPSGGRPSRVIEIDPSFGVMLLADIGERRIRLAATDLSPDVLAETVEPFDLREGPEATLDWIVDRFERLVAELGRRSTEIVGIGLCLPAPVDFAAGRVVGPSIMMGWDDFDIAARLGRRLDAPVYVENDVNLMTLTEVRANWPDAEQFVLIKAGTGIGSGIITDGRLYRGSNGAAGDIGHIQFSSEDAPLCRCGKLGCVEARAGGWAIARDLRLKGFQVDDARGVMALVARNEPEAIHLVRRAGRVLGEVVADVVSVLNPSVIVIAGTLAEAGEHLLAGIREFVYQRSLPLATRQLTICAARSNERAGLLGAARLVLEARLGPPGVEDTIARHRRSRLPAAHGGQRKAIASAA